MVYTDLWMIGINVNEIIIETAKGGAERKGQRVSDRVSQQASGRTENESIANRVQGNHKKKKKREKDIEHIVHQERIQLHEQ